MQRRRSQESGEKTSEAERKQLVDEILKLRDVLVWLIEFFRNGEADCLEPASISKAG